MTSRLEHIGIAVTNSTPVLELLSELLGLTPYKVETVDSEGVDTHFLGAGGVKVELLESNAPDSPIARFLERRGEGIHHLAFEVPNLRAVLDRAIAMGLTPVNPEPKDGADGKLIFFLHPKETYGILIEICQSDRFPGVSRIVSTPRGDVVAFHLGASDAPALLLLHDADSSTAASFGSLMAHLETSLRVLAFDSGHPLSSRGARIQSGGRGTPDAVADDTQSSRGAQRRGTPHSVRDDDLLEQCAVAVMDHFGADVAVVAGAGLGAAAAGALALRFPDRVRGLVLFDPNLLQSDADLAEALSVSNRVSGEAHQDPASASNEPLRDKVERASQVERLRSIADNILIVGLEDASLDRVLRLHGKLAGARLAVIPNSPDRASALALVLSNFVASVQK